MSNIGTIGHSGSPLQYVSIIHPNDSKTSIHISHEQYRHDQFTTYPANETKMPSVSFHLSRISV